MEAETTRLAELERERFEREQTALEAKHAERDQAYLDGNRRLWNELAAETVTPRIEALERRIVELEGGLAQHGELEAAAVSTPTATASEEPAGSRLEQARRFMFGDASEAEIEQLLDEAEDDTTD
jgi:hypothetical protein